MKIFIAFDQMKDEPIGETVLVYISQVFWLIIISEIWVKEAATAAATVNQWDVHFIITSMRRNALSPQRASPAQLW